MRILHVNKFVYRRGGAEAYMLDVASLQQRAGHDVAFFGMQHPENEPQQYAAMFPPYIELETAPHGLVAKGVAAGRMLHSRASRRGLERTLEAFQPDVVHLHNIYHQLSPSLLGALADHGVPSVMTLHDYKLACPSYQFLSGGAVCDACVTGGPWQAAVRRCKNGSRAESTLLAFETWVHRVTGAYAPVDVLISPSEFLADAMRRAGVYPAKLHVLRHFVEHDAGGMKAAPGGGVVFAGRLAAEKGVDVLLDAVARLDGVICDIAGDGPLRDELEARAAARAPGRVRFHGRLPKAELTALLRSAAVAVVPSRWHENQPMAVLEAFACGLPVVATDLGGLPELVASGVDGWIVPPNDADALATAIGSLVGHPERALSMGRAGAAKVMAEFSPAAHLDGLNRLYRLAGARVAPASPALAPT